MSRQITATSFSYSQMIMLKTQAKKLKLNGAKVNAPVITDTHARKPVIIELKTSVSVISNHPICLKPTR